MSKPKVIVDTREQKPLTWEQRNQKGDFIYDIDWVVDKLDCGDYSLSGHDQPGDDNSIIIERKQDCKEILTNLVANWETFERELVKMTRYQNRLIVVCNPENFDVLYRHGMTKVHPNFAFAKMAQIYTKYQIPIIFFDSREKVENYIFRLFYSIIQKTKEEA